MFLKNPSAIRYRGGSSSSSSPATNNNNQNKKNNNKNNCVTMDNNTKNNNNNNNELLLLHSQQQQQQQSTATNTDALHTTTTTTTTTTTNCNNNNNINMKDIHHHPSSHSIVENDVVVSNTNTTTGTSFFSSFSKNIGFRKRFGSTTSSSRWITTTTTTTTTTTANKENHNTKRNRNHLHPNHRYNNYIFDRYFYYDHSYYHNKKQRFLIVIVLFIIMILLLILCLRLIWIWCTYQLYGPDPMWDLQGGLIGRYIDQKQHQRYFQQYQQQRFLYYHNDDNDNNNDKKIQITYPLVQKRANLKNTIGKSRYLYEILCRTMQQQQDRIHSSSSSHQGDEFNQTTTKKHDTHTTNRSTVTTKTTITKTVTAIMVDQDNRSRNTCSGLQEKEEENVIVQRQEIIHVYIPSNKENDDKMNDFQSNQRQIPSLYHHYYYHFRKHKNNHKNMQENNNTDEKSFCIIGYACHRCLNSPFFGTLQKCTNMYDPDHNNKNTNHDNEFPCPICYVQYLQSQKQKQYMYQNRIQIQSRTKYLYDGMIPTTNIKSYDDDIDMDDNDNKMNNNIQTNHTKQTLNDCTTTPAHTSRRIPFVVHQSFPFVVSSSSSNELFNSIQYPELKKIQNSWKRNVPNYIFHHFIYEQHSYHDDEKKNKKQQQPYNNIQVIRYITTHYPPLFLEMYHFLGNHMNNPLHQYQFYQYLVLYREGGIWSSIDLLLETNFAQYLRIDSNVSFLVARVDDTDLNANYKYIDNNNDDNDRTTTENCVYNGLIATQPGHPIIEYMIESIVSFVLEKNKTLAEYNQANAADHRNMDYYLLESMILSSSSSTSFLDIERAELWKLRSSATRNGSSSGGGGKEKEQQVNQIIDDYLFGGCGIGVAINVLLQKTNPFENLFIGKHSIPRTLTNTTTSTTTSETISEKNFIRNSDTTKNKDFGDINILMMSKDDTGAYRCTDMEKNLLIASTSMVGLNLFSLPERTNQSYSVYNRIV